MTDQTERKMTDPLTGLPNRMYFIDHLERRLERAREIGDMGLCRSLSGH